MTEPTVHMADRPGDPGTVIVHDAAKHQDAVRDGHQSGDYPVTRVGETTDAPGDILHPTDPVALAPIGRPHPLDTGTVDAVVGGRRLGETPNPNNPGVTDSDVLGPAETTVPTIGEPLVAPGALEQSDQLR